MPYAHITGWGMAVPESIMTNDDLAKTVDTNDAWIRERTGIRERRIAKPDEFPSTLGVDASIKALKIANVRPTDLDLIICTSSSPEYIFPATACLIQDQLGATKAGAFDLLAACTGFIFALNMFVPIKTSTTTYDIVSIKNGSQGLEIILGGEEADPMAGAGSCFCRWQSTDTLARRSGRRDPADQTSPATSVICPGGTNEDHEIHGQAGKAAKYGR